MINDDDDDDEGDNDKDDDDEDEDDTQGVCGCRQCRLTTNYGDQAQPTNYPTALITQYTAKVNGYS